MENSAEIKELTLSLYKAIENGEIASFLERLIPQQSEALLIGTDPDEWFSGYKAIIKGIKPKEEALTGSSMISDIHAYRQGDVGWFADNVQWVFPDGTEVLARITGVYEKEAGAWKLVQWHGSVGVANEDVGVDV